jgi:hypothetical protein
MATAAADHNLLFGLLALQNGLINQVQLVAAFQAWTLDKARALADHLVGRWPSRAQARSEQAPMALAKVRRHKVPVVVNQVKVGARVNGVRVPGD